MTQMEATGRKSRAIAAGIAVVAFAAFAALAGAATQGEVEKAQRREPPQIETVFEAEPLTCAAINPESMSAFQDLLAQQEASQADETGVGNVYAYRGGITHCWICYFRCYRIRC